MNDNFIYTEAVNCGLILKKCLETFFKYHPNVNVHVFGFENDLNEVNIFPNVIPHDITNDNDCKRFYQNGHLGTAYIGAKVITEYAKNHKYIIHFDSDIIFREECLSFLIDKIESGYDLIGPRRCYEKNMNGRTDLIGLPDLVQTYFYAYNREKITTNNFSILQNMIVGYHSPKGYPILDYFDPVSFEILDNGGNIYFLDSDNFGGLTINGDKKNKYYEFNEDTDFGEKLIHFAGIGSGMKFYYYGGNTHDGYIKWAIRRFGMYYKLFYDESFNGIEIDEHKYKIFKDLFNETNNKL